MRENTMEKTTDKTIITVVGKDIVDMSSSAKPFADCVKELEQLGEEIGVKIRCQREEIFDMMHRI